MKTSMKVKANGIAINYQVDGPERAPWLVFSNSLATSLAMWDEQAAALKDRFRVLRYDQRGHGETEAPAGRYAFDTLLDDALALMDALGIVKATFAGLSMGGRHRAWARRAAPGALRAHHCRRFTMPIDAAIEPAMGRADRGGAETRHRSPDRADRGA